MARSTKATRERYMAMLETPEWLARQVVDLQPDPFRRLRADLLQMRDALARERGPGAATVFGQGVASLFTWAVERGRMAVSPLMRLRALPGGHIPAWTAADAQRAMEKWPEFVRRAVVLNFHIGQRRGDLTQLRWDAYEVGAGIISLQPEKTRRRREASGKPPLRLVVPSALAWELRRWREEAPAAEFILTRADGRPWTRSALSNAVRKQLLAEGWPTKRGLHGLRKLLAQTLKEAGASDGEIGAAQGWDSARTIRLYTSGADQETMARSAIARLEKAVAKNGKAE